MPKIIEMFFAACGLFILSFIFGLTASIVDNGFQIWCIFASGAALVGSFILFAAFAANRWE